MKTNKNYARIANRIYGKPWCLQESSWFNIHSIYQNHLKNGAVKLYDDDGDDMDSSDSTTTIIGKIAVVPLDGVILKHASSLEQICGACDIDTFLAQVTKAYNDENIETIVLDVNSPGGEVTGVKEAADKIRSMAKTKQIVSFTDSLCASAAYWIASATAGIFTTETAEIGSIGVYCGLYDLSAQFSMEGIKPVLIKSGQFKGDGFPGLPISQDTIARIQADVDATRAMFVSAVLQNRDIADSTLQGQTFMGLDCVGNGMADLIVSDLNELIETLSIDTIK